MKWEAELLISDIGEARIVIVPHLPFIAEGARVDADRLEIFGGGKRIVFHHDGERLAQLGEVGGFLLIERASSGEDSDRETDILIEAL